MDQKALDSVNRLYGDRAKVRISVPKGVNLSDAERWLAKSTLAARAQLAPQIAKEGLADVESAKDPIAHVSEYASVQGAAEGLDPNQLLTAFAAIREESGV